MLFQTHKEEIIQQNIKKLKPLKYNKFYLEKDYKQAEIYINECLELSKKDNNNFMINVSSISLAYIYLSS